MALNTHARLKKSLEPVLRRTGELTTNDCNPIDPLEQNVGGGEGEYRKDSISQF